MTHCPAPTRRRRKPFLARLSQGHRGRRLLALAAAFAVPAMAAPGEWAALEFADVPSQPAPMAFETPGENFPGSAFFYLEDLPQLAEADLPPPIATGAHHEGEFVTPSAAATSGPAAPAFQLVGDGTDKARALQCMTMAIYYEAASESTQGQRAVAQVVLNRVAHPSYPASVCGVVFQGSERRTGCQFSFTCDGSLSRKPAAAGWARARAVAQAALGGYVERSVGFATHYHATYVLPYWAASLDNVGTIGLHTFYRWRGAAGRREAFTLAYRGGEPVAAPQPRSAATGAGSAPDPIVLAQAYEAARARAAAQVVAAAVPQRYSPAIEARGGDTQFTAEKLPRSGGVKNEYANAGRWIARPGGT